MNLSSLNIQPYSSHYIVAFLSIRSHDYRIGFFFPIQKQEQNVISKLLCIDNTDTHQQLVLVHRASQSRSKTSSNVSRWIKTGKQTLEVLGKFQMILAWTRRCVYSLSAVMLTCVTFVLQGASKRGHRTDEAEMKDGKEHFWNMTQACLHVAKSFHCAMVHSWSLSFICWCVYTVLEYFLRHLLMSFMEANIYRLD